MTHSRCGRLPAAQQMAALQAYWKRPRPIFDRRRSAARSGRSAEPFHALPPGKGYDDKFVWGLYSARQ